MALPLPPGLTPPEIAFLCEMELVTIVPRQRLEALALLGVCIPHLRMLESCMCPCVFYMFHAGRLNAVNDDL